MESPAINSQLDESLPVDALRLVEVSIADVRDALSRPKSAMCPSLSMSDVSQSLAQ